MGGTKWNKGGTSEGTYGPVDWDHFSVQKLPSVGSGGAENGQKCAFLAISSSGGPKWVEQSGTRVEQVRGKWKICSCFPITLIKCLKDKKSKRLKVSKIAL